MGTFFVGQVSSVQNEKSQNAEYQSDINILEKKKSQVEEQIRKSEKDKDKQQHIPAYQVQLQAIEAEIRELQQKQVSAKKVHDQTIKSAKTSKGQTDSSKVVRETVDVEA